MKKILFLLLLILIFIVGFLLIGKKNFKSSQVKAAAGDNVSGWAWSENIGWISFNCTTDPDSGPCVSSNYGVNIDEVTGNLTGYAWSENIGWIHFDPTGAYPETPAYSARLDLVTNEFKGWARALAYGGGWDGWIKMAGIATDGSSYGVVRNICDIEGWAWGSDVVGWIDFYDVTTTFCANQAPYVKPGSQVVEYQTYCEIALGTGQVGFRWKYRDDDGDNESRFDFRVNNVNNVNDLNPEVDRTVNGLSNPDGTVNTQAVLVVTPFPGPGSDKIAYNTPYYWWVRVWDSKGANSGWVAGPGFTTYAHALPWPDFTHSPSVPSVDEVVYFTDNSTCYDAANDSYRCQEINPITGTNNTYLWDFGDGATSSDIGDTTHIYSEPSEGYTVELSVTDDLGTCTGTGDTPMITTLPLPEWKEIPPF